MYFDVKQVPTYIGNLKNISQTVCIIGPVRIIGT
jgi:hypothetical protein